MNDREFSPLSQPLPSANRPLLGLTILAVEDSHHACEALRLICLRSGARLRRADCLRSARRHLQVYRPAVLIVDLGLPDGSGLELIADLQNARPRIGAILATSGDSAQCGAARAAGADGFLPKPLGSVASFQETVLGLLPADRQPMGPRRLPDEVLHPDPIAYGDDMAHALVLLGNTEAASTLDYALQFLASVAHNAQDTPLMDLCTKVQTLRRSRAPAPTIQAALARLAAAVRERQDCRAAI